MEGGKDHSPRKDNKMTIFANIVLSVWGLVGLYFMYMVIRDDIISQREKRERKAIETERAIRQSIRDEEWRERLRQDSI